MKEIQLKDLVTRLKSDEHKMPGPSVDESWRVFHARLKKTSTPTSFPWARYLIPAGSVLALAMIALSGWFFFLQDRFDESTRISFRKKGAIELADIPQKEGLVFRYEVAVRSGKGNLIQIGAGTSARLLSAAADGSIWSLDGGKIRIENSDSNTRSRFFVADLEIRELGTAYTLERDQKTVTVFVREGLVSISNQKDHSYRLLSKGMSWKGDARTTLSTPIQDAQAGDRAASGKKASIPDHWEASVADENLHFGFRDNALELWEKNPPILRGRVAMPNAEGGIFLAVTTDLAVALTYSGRALLFKTQSLKMIREESIGPVAARNLVLRPDGASLVNAQGEIFFIDLRGEIALRKKILRSSLWEGILFTESGEAATRRHIWILPDVEAKLVFWDLDNKRLIGEKTLPGTVLSPLGLQPGKSPGEWGNILATLPEGTRAISLKECLTGDKAP